RRTVVRFVELARVVPGLDIHADLDGIEGAAHAGRLDARQSAVGAREAIRPLVVVEAAAEGHVVGRHPCLPTVSATHDDMRLAVHLLLPGRSGYPITFGRPALIRPTQPTMVAQLACCA